MKDTIAITAIIFTFGVVTLPVVFSDNEFHWGEMEEYERKSSGISAVDNPVYKEECGSCHMAYPAGLLPANSWGKIMSGLDEHFGDNAEIDEATYKIISDYLSQNSADQSKYGGSRKFNQSIQSADVPVRVSEIPYFKHEHNEIPQRMISGNPEVKSFSNCNSCHSKAEQGLFNEHDVRIPGYGRWDD